MQPKNVYFGFPKMIDSIGCEPGFDDGLVSAVPSSWHYGASVYMMVLTSHPAIAGKTDQAGTTILKKRNQTIARLGNQTSWMTRGPKDHINIRILQNTVAGISLVLDLRTRMWNPEGFLGSLVPPHPCLMLPACS